MKTSSTKTRNKFAAFFAFLITLSPALSLGCTVKMNWETGNVEKIECGNNCIASINQFTNEFEVNTQQTGFAYHLFNFIENNKTALGAGVGFVLTTGVTYLNEKRRDRIQEQQRKEDTTHRDNQLNEIAKGLSRILNNEKCGENDLLNSGFFGQANQEENQN